jgi:hypothetical protein
MAQSAALGKHVTLQTVDGKPTVVISAANLQVNNGLGATDTINGTGNIIIGYDEKRAPTGSLGNCSLAANANNLRGLPVVGILEARLDNEQNCTLAGGSWSVDNKSGSHYLVVGPGHFYSAYAGIVAGYWNLSNGKYASVTGGGYNASSGFGSIVVGGVSNAAYGGSGCRSLPGAPLGSVSEPIACWPSGQGNPYQMAAWTSVLGGEANLAWGGQGAASTVSGGAGNQAAGHGASVSGGANNKANASIASVSGGSGNSAQTQRSSILGGVSKTTTQDNQAIPAVP